MPCPVGAAAALSRWRSPRQLSPPTPQAGTGRDGRAVGDLGCMGGLFSLQPGWSSAGPSPGLTQGSRAEPAPEQPHGLALISVHWF